MVPFTENLKKLKRKKVLINPRFQLIFILFTVLISLFAVLIMYMSSFYFFWKLGQVGIGLGLPSDSVFFEYIMNQKMMMNHITGVTSVLLFSVIFVAGLFYSHRIAGPLLRLERHMRSIAGGRELSKIKFRRGDLFPELSVAFNEMCKKVQERSSRKDQ